MASYMCVKSFEEVQKEARWVCILFSIQCLAYMFIWLYVICIILCKLFIWVTKWEVIKQEIIQTTQASGSRWLAVCVCVKSLSCSPSAFLWPTFTYPSVSRKKETGDFTQMVVTPLPSIHVYHTWNHTPKHQHHWIHQPRSRNCSWVWAFRQTSALLV